MLGMNRDTGLRLSGWEHVIQCLQVIFLTGYGERVMREWFGSMVPHILGENLVEDTVLKFFYSVAVAIELYEPRFKLVEITIERADSQGHMGFVLVGEYFPNALSGDYASNIRKSLLVIAKQSGLVVSPLTVG